MPAIILRIEYEDRTLEAVANYYGQRRASRENLRGFCEASINASLEDIEFDLSQKRQEEEDVK